MGEVEEMQIDGASAGALPPPKEMPVSEERLLDAQAIEDVAATMTRVSARMHLESLAKKLRKESEALKRVEASRAMAASADTSPPVAEMPGTTETPAAAAAMPGALKQPAVAPPMPSSAKYVPIDKFSFDASGYNSPHVSVYVSLPNVGSIPRDNITCTFTPSSFDLIVKDLNGKSYRLFQDNLEKDIEPEKSKHIVKADKVIVKLAKKKSEYGSYDYWSGLVDKKKHSKLTGKGSKDNPTESLMGMMKDLYDTGDDNIRKVIGETMEKQRRGELGKGSGGLGELDDI